MELTILGNWILTATRSSLPVGDTEGERIAVWTCPMDAAAKGIRSKEIKLSVHDGPRALVMTCCAKFEREFEREWDVKSPPFANLACNERCLGLCERFYRFLEVTYGYLMIYSG